MINKIFGIIKGYKNNLVFIDLGIIEIVSFMAKPERLKIDEKVNLLSMLIWNSENGPSLYSFFDENEKNFFNYLMECPGIGPKMSINILHHLDLNILFNAIIENKPKVISNVPGIGIKKAEMIIVKLKNEVEKLKNLNFEKDNYNNDLYEALNSLGYKGSEITNGMKILFKNENKGLSFSDLLTLALKEIEN